MNLELDRKEMETLVELAYLADWMANGIHPGEGEKKYGGLIQKIYTLAEEEGLGYLIATDPESGGLKGSPALMARIEEADVVGHYDEHVFWDELSLQLAERDLMEEIGETAMRAMRPHELDDKIDEIAAKYDDEFEKNGLKKLRLRGAAKGGKGDGLADKLKKLFDDGE